ncbi:MAG: magnesium transporter [bacterium]|nr:magnesium transporter [bacterium]
MKRKATAAELLSKRVPTARSGELVESIRSTTLHERCQWDSVTYVYVLDAQDHLIGVISMKELICADAGARIDDIMVSTLITAHPTTDHEHVAMTAIRHRIKAVPVVDSDRRFLGVVGTDAILKTLHEEHVEDFLKYAGIRRTGTITDLLTARVGTLIHHRLPWLLVGLAGSMVATLLVRAFDHVLEQELALAFFIPLIVYMADAFGTQTQTLYIRGRVMERIPFWRTFAREIAVALGVGAACAVLLFAFALIGFQSVALAWTVGLALMSSILIAGTLALTITALLERLGKDSALGGGPLATVIQDVVSLAIYFLIASVIIF